MNQQQLVHHFTAIWLRILMIYYGRSLTTSCCRVSESVRFGRSLTLTAEPHAGFSTTTDIIRQNRHAALQRFHLYVKQTVMLISAIWPRHAAYLMTPIIDVNAKNIHHELICAYNSIKIMIVGVIIPKTNNKHCGTMHLLAIS